MTASGDSEVKASGDSKALSGGGRLRVATYNVHKCVGLDRRVRPARVAAVLREIDADVCALQEVVSVESDSPREAHQARFIAGELGFEFRVGENRRHKGGAYGNVVLTRLPVLGCHNYDITWRGREPRGALRVDLKIDAAGAGVLHLFNVHLGTAFVERRHQGRKLVGESVLRDPKLAGPRVVLGDFNEWPRACSPRSYEAPTCARTCARAARTPASSRSCTSTTSTTTPRSGSNGSRSTAAASRSSPRITCRWSPTSAWTIFKRMR